MWKYLKLTIYISLLGFAYTQQSMANESIFYLGHDIYLEKGSAALELGQYQKAIDKFKRGLKGHLSLEQRVSVENAICVAENALGKHHEAIQSCDRALGINKHYWQAFINRGNAKNKLGDKVSAYEDYCSAKAIAPNKIEGSFQEACS